MVADDSTNGPGRPLPKRIIKRYSNRKLYDTKGSSYVTLLQIAEMVRAGEEVQIIDNATKEDKTDVTLALIISEELKSTPRGIPLGTLKDLIRQSSEKFLSHLRESPVGRFIPGEGVEERAEGAPAPQGPAEPVHTLEDNVGDANEEGRRESSARGLRATLEQWQSTIDERIRTALPNFSVFRELQAELQKLSQRLEKLEERVEELAKKNPPEPRE
ncbi:MAG: polyhydroxyalkanoate synthesis regulator DNA-binding domain-containing protein [Polyangiaceae bacterium]|nr:polyhydroxyalkanoate synthesis regulator DNA-binding domain-containing protein [Polyangiaceae bacterium]